MAAERDTADESLAGFLRTRWLPAIESTVRATTFLNYRSHVERHIVPRLGGVRLCEIDGSALNELYASLLVDGRVDGKGGLRAATVRRVHATLHRALRDAVRWGLLGDNPADRADPPRLRADMIEMRTWDLEELRAFLQFVEADPHYPLWLILATTGMRRGEALGLRWRDVDLDAGQVAIRQTIVAVGYEVRLSSPKTARGRRVVALDAMTVAALREHRIARDERPSKNHSDLIFCSGDGRPLHPCHVSKRFALLVAGSPVPAIRLHDLRHTHATVALRAGIHPKIVSERLGHATVSMTLDVYSHAIPHMQKEAADRMGRLVFG